MAKSFHQNKKDLDAILKRLAENKLRGKKLKKAAEREAENLQNKRLK